MRYAIRVALLIIAITPSLVLKAMGELSPVYFFYFVVRKIETIYISIAYHFMRHKTQQQKEDRNNTEYNGHI